MPRQLLLVSSSRCHPYAYLDHCEAELQQLFAGLSEVLFVPYARPTGQTYEAYTVVARDRFEKMGIGLRGIHELADPRTAVANAMGVFIGGGNSFVLLRELYQFGLLTMLRQRIADGMPYMGSSAGSNVAGLTIGTSNDMPIVHPPSFDALGVVPFNLNPHYPSAKPDPTHKGETRDDRIREFHCFNTQPVVALREDGMLRIVGDTAELIGQREALVFRPGRGPVAVGPGPMMQHLF